MGLKGEVEKTQNAGQVIGNTGAPRDEEGSASSEEDEQMRDVEEGKGERGIKEGKGEDGWIEVTVDIPGQRDDDAMVIFLAQMLHEGLVADGGLRNRLVINSKWHWRLYIDVRPILPSKIPASDETQQLTTKYRFSSSPPQPPTPSPSSP